MPSRLYDIGAAALRAGAKLLGRVDAKAARRAAGAEAALDGLAPTPPHRDCYWMHCASVGEFEQGRPVWHRLMALAPEARFVLTFFSPSGVEWFAGRTDVGEVRYLPWDTRREAEALVGRLSPKLALFVKYEWWLNTHAVLRERGVPTVAFSVAFRQNQPFFRRWHPLHRGYRELLEGLTAVFVQSADSAALLATHGYRQRARVVGDTRLDRVLRLATEDFSDVRIERWLGGRTRLLVAGSTWPKDEELLEGLLAARADYCLLCAPHEVDAESRERLLSRFAAFAPVCYAAEADTQTDGTVTAPADSGRDSRVMILDAKGVLAKAYRYGRLAHVGGGFGAGVHNTLEPVAYRLPVAIGPRYRRFDEAVALAGASVVVPCERVGDLVNFVARFDDERELARTRETAGAYLAEHGGATDAIVAYLTEQHLI